MYSHHFESAHYANNVHLCRYMLYGFNLKSEREFPLPLGGWEFPLGF